MKDMSQGFNTNENVNDQEGISIHMEMSLLQSPIKIARLKIPSFSNAINHELRQHNEHLSITSRLYNRFLEKTKQRVNLFPLPKGLHTKFQDYNDYYDQTASPLKLSTPNQSRTVFSQLNAAQPLQPRKPNSFSKLRFEPTPKALHQEHFAKRPKKRYFQRGPAATLCAKKS